MDFRIATSKAKAAEVIRAEYAEAPDYYAACVNTEIDKVLAEIEQVRPGTIVYVYSDYLNLEVAVTD